jgi:ubiquinone/menaquinone biosynthesis C-methylase UbiE
MESEPLNPNLELLRDAESALFLAYLKPGMRVLELGGGNGYQAKRVSDHGCFVVSLDVRDRPRPDLLHFPVEDYDGVHIPAGEATFDAVFSSSVLEHIRDLPATLREVRRVLKPSGFAVHIMPSAVWRFWTILARYPYFAKRLLRPPPAAAAPRGAKDERSPLRRLGSLIKRALIEPPHGEYSSSFAELYHYRRDVWRRIFEQNGYDVVDAHDNGLFYTGFSTFPVLSIARRRALARLLGASCNVFVVKPKGSGSPASGAPSTP